MKPDHFTSINYRPFQSLHLPVAAQAHLSLSYKKKLQYLEILLKLLGRQCHFCVANAHLLVSLEHVRLFIGSK